MAFGARRLLLRINQAISNDFDYSERDESPARTPEEAVPITGSLIGDAGHQELHVRVEVTAGGAVPAAA